MTQVYSTQNDLLLNNLLEFYKGNDNMDKMLNIINPKASNITTNIKDITNASIISLISQVLFRLLFCKSLWLKQFLLNCFYDCLFR